MTRNEALEIAKANHKSHHKAIVDLMFGRTPGAVEAEIDQTHGYRHGWYRVAEFSFDTDEITGVPYDHTQGGWAYL
jgi:hypothetical protein